MHRTLMMVATLLATVTFQVGMNPPGGFRQDDSGRGKNSIAHAAGGLIMAQSDPYWYNLFMKCDTISFGAWLSITLLLISGFPLKRRLFTGIVTPTLWVATIYTALTYALGIRLFTRDNEVTAFTAVRYAAEASDAIELLVALLFVCHLLRFVLKLLRKVWKLVRKVLKFVCSALKKQEEQGDLTV